MPLESFADFLGDEFDIKSFSATVLQTKLVADYLQHLNELIRTLDAEIKQQVKRPSFSRTPCLLTPPVRQGRIERARALPAGVIHWNHRRRAREYAITHRIAEIHRGQVRQR